MCYSVYVVKTDNDFFNERKTMFRDNINDLSTYDLLENIMLMSQEIKQRSNENDSHIELLAKIQDLAFAVKQQVK